MTDMIRPSAICLPWTLHFDRDGTEDVAVICDGDGHDLMSSRCFWRPAPQDAIPETLASAVLMTAAPKLLNALDVLLRETVDQDMKSGLTLSQAQAAARALALEAIAEATGDWTRPAIREGVDVQAALAERQQIAVVWEIADVKLIRPDLSEDQAWHVLQAAEDGHDANLGITWEVLRFHAEYLFGDEPEHATRTEG